MDFSSYGVIHNEDNKWIKLKDELTQKYIELRGKSNKITMIYQLLR